MVAFELGRASKQMLIYPQNSHSKDVVEPGLDSSSAAPTSLPCCHLKGGEVGGMAQ